ncbi:RNA polymerase sigma factor SigJ [Arthrobacter sp. zg-Y40]|uniref:RNA polymerase sigma factor SigJ n=1 Tax=unclassified Arthrobacter TaxID=235627 RepID=UPI001D1513D2|nr:MULTISPECIES: RNA polymerase sigma factor SigJ [unclassified Arthrobacter]MCC3279443.1 RNA polymerase sigma factor SigJ [Arthrobacter sp. zg-Y40]MDK1327605.1 RNA polymerase sigma factor SigJ [Arthrobacter sp. zg-Y1143]
MANRSEDAALGAGGAGPDAGLSSGLPERNSQFLNHRALVFTIAYDILGTVADAEDVVQESYLRWRAVPEPVANPRAYLARIATRQALNSLRAASRRREEYPGEWLPEPLRTGPDALASDPEAAALTAGEVSTAMLVVLQALTGPERAAFLLHDVFDFGYPEIAAALDAGEPAARQMVHRARVRLRSGTPRTAPDTGEHRAAVQRFLAAAMTGKVQSLLDLLAPEVVLVSDGGGKASAALRPVHGPEKVARLMLGLAGKYGAGAVPEFVELNGLPAVAFREAGAVTTVFQLGLSGDGRVQAVFAVRNPDKLLRLQG